MAEESQREKPKEFAPPRLVRDGMCAPRQQDELFEGGVAHYFDSTKGGSVVGRNVNRHYRQT